MPRCCVREGRAVAKKTRRVWACSWGRALSAVEAVISLPHRTKYPDTEAGIPASIHAFSQNFGGAVMHSVWQD